MQAAAVFVAVDSSEAREVSVAKTAFDVLTEDHNKVKKLMNDLERTGTGAVATRKKLLDEIELELKVHAQIEEEIFYPAYHRAAGKKPEDQKLFYESAEEHHLVDLVLPELIQTKPSSEVFSAKAKVLQDVFEHHANEEESQMFPRAKKLMSKDELEELADMLETRKKELLDDPSQIKPTMIPIS